MLVTIVGLIVVLCSGASGESGLQSTLTRGLVSSSVTERAEAKNRLLKERAAIIADLITIANQPPAADPNDASGRFSAKKLAIQMLGEFRAAEAVDVLCANLRYEVEVFGGTLGELSSPGTRYPAAKSLAQIGVPSLKKVWSRIQTTNDPVEEALCSWILREIEGEDNARKLLRQRIDETQNERVKVRFEKSLQLLDVDKWPLRTEP